MDVDFEKRYVYSELYAILDWLGEDFKAKIPSKTLKFIQGEKKFGYEPQIDFSKPLQGQIRQDTANYIAYFYCKYWLTNSKRKEEIVNKIAENQQKSEEIKKRERAEEIKKRAQSSNNDSVGMAFNKLMNSQNDEG